MNPLSHPLTIFFISVLTLTLTAAYTSRDSKFRYITLAFLFLPAYTLPLSLSSYAQTTGWFGRVPAGAVAWNIVACFERLILRDWDYEHYYPPPDNDSEQRDTAKDHKAESAGIQQFQGSRLEFASEITGSARGVNLFWEVKNVPHFSCTRPNFVPSRSAFLLVQTVAIITCYYSHNAVVEAMLGVNHEYLDASRIPLLTRLPEVTLQEFKARVVASLGYWIVQHNMLQFFYSLFALLSVTTNPNELASWRPTFGSFTEAYTLRNFWGKSWHQNLRSGCEGVSNFTAHNILQLPKHGLLQRYTKILCSFLISGLMHARADTGGEMAMRESGAVQFFCMQAVGIVIEDGVQDAYAKYFKGRHRSKSNVLEKAIGYAWVLFFLVWTTPVWVFPCILNMRREDALLSWSAVRPVFVGR